jgi:hypothetical protein
MVEMDALVSWYVNVLFVNIFKVHDPLMELVEKDDEAEETAKIDLLRFLVASRLANEKSGFSDGMQEVVASEKLRRNSRWLLAGKKPNRQVDQYMWRLTRHALMFLEKRAA